MSVRYLKILLLKGMVVTLPFGWWSPLPIPYTDLKFLFIYAYLTLSFLTLKQSLSWFLFRRYALPLVVIWLIMFTMTYFVFRSVEAEDADSIVRQFIFYAVFFGFALKDVSIMAHRGEYLYWYFFIAVIGLVAAFFTIGGRDFGAEGRQSRCAGNTEKSTDAQHREDSH